MKVSDIKFDLNGVSYKVNVNCSSSGEFTANLPENVAETLRLDKKLKSNTLASLVKDFNDKIEAYKKAETSVELYILIAYQARGKYTYRKDGSVLFSHLNKKYYIENSFDTVNNAVGIDFTVAIKEIIDTKVKWFKAKLGKDFSHICREEQSQPDVYHKEGEISEFRIDRYKIIPFSETALNTLQAAEDKLRDLSEMLFNFIEQDEVKILETLSSQKLLN